MKVACIMPCYGRAEQTERNLRRLQQSAGFRAEYIATAFESEVWKTLQTMGKYSPKLLTLDTHATYWQGMKLGMKLAHDCTHVVNLANDLLPGYKWLKKGVDAYIRRFGSTPGLMGFNDGIHGPEHSPHFLIDVRLLEEFGGWPTWYTHNYGDTELCQRAMEQNRYGKAAWAVLYHDHRVTGAEPDEIYAEGDHSFPEDLTTYQNRSQARWEL